ncbi:hypothetical protein [Mycoplasma buteonis]|uniref:hypothetical protein n=1 Tax=Mycoplasma buteonis TaxID=171280 RepID=UPI0005663F24|nr:hypothetical protein [Mycoplasma buteonis]
MYKTEIEKINRARKMNLVAAILQGISLFFVLVSLILLFSFASNTSNYIAGFDSHTHTHRNIEATEGIGLAAINAITGILAIATTVVTIISIVFTIQANTISNLRNVPEYQNCTTNVWIGFALQFVIGFIGNIILVVAFSKMLKQLNELEERNNFTTETVEE